MDANGTVTAHKAGTAKITATSKTDTNKNTTVTVTVPTPGTPTAVSVVLTPTTPLDKDQKALMIATVEINSATDTVKFTETDSSGDAITTGGQVVSYTQNGNTLTLTAVAPGETWITATSKFDNTQKTETKITVNGVKSIHIAGTAPYTTVIGTPLNLDAIVAVFGTTTNTDVRWASDTPTTATVVANPDGTGKVTPIATGTTTITATSDADPTKIATVTVTVNPLPPLIYTQEVPHGTAVDVNPIFAGNIVVTGVTYTLETTGTGTVSTPEPPTIDPTTGAISVKSTTTAGTYIITTTPDEISYAGIVETAFYVTTSPTNIYTLRLDLKAGIENFGLTADFNYIKTGAVEIMSGLFHKDHDTQGDYTADSKPYIVGFNGDISLWDVSFCKRHESYV